PHPSLSTSLRQRSISCCEEPIVNWPAGISTNFMPSVLVISLSSASSFLVTCPGLPDIANTVTSNKPSTPPASPTSTHRRRNRPLRGCLPPPSATDSGDG